MKAAALRCGTSKAKLDAQLDAAIAAVGTVFSAKAKLVEVRADLGVARSAAGKVKALMTTRVDTYNTAVATAKSDIVDAIIRSW